MSLRDNLNELPTVVNTVIKVFFTLINETGQEAFFYVLFVVALVYFGRETALTLLFGIVLSIVLTGLAKQGLGLPRPFVYVPQLQLSPANGFGMPSMNAMLSTVIYGIFYLALKRKQVKSSTLRIFGQFCVFLIILQSFARVWLGIHFLSDVVVGVLLGLMVVYHFSSLQKKHGDLLYRVLGSVSFWLLMAVITSGIAFVMFYMNYLYVAALCWGTTLALILKKDQRVLTSVKGRLIAFLSIIVLLVTFRFGTYMVLDFLPSGSVIVLSVKAAANFLLIFFILMFPMWLASQFSNKRK